MAANIVVMEDKNP